jgi:probable rRNA maturation factor
MRINIFNQTNEETRKIKKLLKKVFKPIEEDKSMQIVLVTQDEIHEMNKKYRDIDRPTDVLSFPNDDESDTSIGDIFISIEQAHKQALDYEHSFEREIGFLSVHGYLHLKGYDHHTKVDEKIMMEEQERILKLANLERNTK